MSDIEDRLPAYFLFKKYGITPLDVVHMAFHCEPEQIQPAVILMPSWKADIFLSDVVSVKEIVPASIYQLEYQERSITIIRSGIGAPQVGDTMLALACTPCRHAFFTGSAGGLGMDLAIGDLLVVERSVCGDGFSRYLVPELLPPDRFLQDAFPDPDLTTIVREQALRLVAGAVPVHQGAVFSTDSIMAQFSRLGTIRERLDCLGIEMETAAFFQAARLVGIRAAALLQVSDLPERGRSLFSGRSQEERDHYHQVRKDILSRVVLHSLLDASLPELR